jgi:hypothetical protein
MDHDPRDRRSEPPAAPEIRTAELGPKEKHELDILAVLLDTDGANLHLVHTLTGVPFGALRRHVLALEAEGILTTWTHDVYLPLPPTAGVLARLWRRLWFPPPSAKSGVPAWGVTTFAGLSDDAGDDPRVAYVREVIRDPRLRSLDAHARAQAAGERV